MTAARYWRLIALASYGGGDLELSELHLHLAGSRVDAGATISTTLTPSAGAVANLQDNDTGTTCRWAAADVRAGGFAIRWDFGVGVTQDVDCIRLGSSSSKALFARAALLQRSSDGVLWTSTGDAPGIIYPGNMAMTAAQGAVTADASDILFMRMEGVDGATVVTDDAGHTFTSVNGAALTTSSPISEGASLSTNGTNQSLSTPYNANLDIGAGAFYTRFKFRAASSPVGRMIWGRLSDAFAITREYGTYVPAADQIGLYWGTRGANQAQHLFTNPSGNFAIGQDYEGLLGRDASGNWYGFVDGRPCAHAVANSATVVDQTSLSNASIGMSVGRSGLSFNDSWPGLLDDIRIRKAAPPFAAYIPRPLSQPFYIAPCDHALATALRGGYQVEGEGTEDSTVVVSSAGGLARDMEFGGAGTISGTVKIDATPLDIPVSRRVRLVHTRSGIFVRETWSDPVTGEYAFTGIAAGYTYHVEAFDHTLDNRAVIADRITPEVA